MTRAICSRLGTRYKDRNLKRQVTNGLEFRGSPAKSQRLLSALLHRNHFSLAETMQDARQNKGEPQQTYLRARSAAKEWIPEGEEGGRKIRRQGVISIEGRYKSQNETDSVSFEEMGIV